MWSQFYQRLESKARRLIDPLTGHVDRRYVKSVPCPLCGMIDTAPRVQRDGFDYVTCNRCSFVYINPQLTQQAILNVYNDEDVRRFFLEQLLLPYVERDQQAEFEERALVLKSFVSNPKPRLLDIGCALGNFLLMAEKIGFQGEGLELNKLYVDYAKQHRSVTIRQQLLEDMHYPDNAFDVVTLWDVLEHLPKPLDTLKDVARVVSPGGIIGITTINHSCVNEKILKDRWRYYMPPDHLCSFTPEILESILNRCGFTIVKLRHHYMFEVLADHYFRFLNSSNSTNPVRNSIGKVKKLVYILLAQSTQFLFNRLRSGDLLTVYARKL